MKKCLLLALLCFSLLAYVSSLGAFPAGFLGSGGAPVVAAASYDCTTDASALGCYYMNCDGCNELDRSGQGNTLQQVSIPPTDTDDPWTGDGLSRDFNGSNQYLYCTNAGCPDFDVSGADAKITLAAYVKVAAIADTEANWIIAKWAWEDNKKAYLLRVLGTAANEFRFQFFVSDDGDAYQSVYTTKTDYVTGTWYHVAAVLDDVDLRIYVDGVLNCTPTAHTTGIHADSAENFQVSGFGPYFDGLIDEVLFANDALTAGQILYIKQNGVDGAQGASG